MSHTKKIAKESKQNIFFIQAETEIGLPCYYYVLVRPEKISQFEKIGAGMGANLDDYGIVLEKGFGEPNAEVKKMMREEYGFEGS